jgi:hypothetical protein
MAISKQVRPIYVSLPPTQLTLEQSQKVIAEIMRVAGCPGCFSGRDINFVNEVDFFVSEEARVRPAAEVEFA